MRRSHSTLYRRLVGFKLVLHVHGLISVLSLSLVFFFSLSLSLSRSLLPCGSLCLPGCLSSVTLQTLSSLVNAYAESIAEDSRKRKSCTVLRNVYKQSRYVP